MEECMSQKRHLVFTEGQDASRNSIIKQLQESQFPADQRYQQHESQEDAELGSEHNDDEGGEADEAAVFLSHPRCERQQN